MESVLQEGYLTYRRCRFSTQSPNPSSSIGGPRRRYFQLLSSGHLVWDKGQGNSQTKIDLCGSLKSLYNSFPSEYMELHQWLTEQDSTNSGKLDKELRILHELHVSNTDQRIFTMVLDQTAMGSKVPSSRLHLAREASDLVLLFEAPGASEANKWSNALQSVLSCTIVLETQRESGSEQTCTVEEHGLYSENVAEHYFSQAQTGVYSATQYAQNDGYTNDSSVIVSSTRSEALLHQFPPSPFVAWSTHAQHDGDNSQRAWYSPRSQPWRNLNEQEIPGCAFERQVFWDESPHTNHLTWCSSLFQAVLEGNVHRFTDLMERGASIYDLDEQGRTVAHVAVLAGASGLPILALLSQCAEHLLEMQDRHGNTPLHLAVANQNFSSTKLLLETAVSPTIQNEDGWTPLSLVSSADKSLKRLVMLYRDSVGIAQIPTQHEDPVDLERIMKVWEAFFSNAIRGTLDCQSASESKFDVMGEPVVELLSESPLDSDYPVDSAAESSFSQGYNEPNQHNELGAFAGDSKFEHFDLRRGEGYRDYRNGTDEGSYSAYGEFHANGNSSSRLANENYQQYNEQYQPEPQFSHSPSYLESNYYVTNTHYNQPQFDNGRKGPVQHVYYEPEVTWDQCQELNEAYVEKPTPDSEEDWVLYWSVEYQHNYWFNLRTFESVWSS